MSASQFPLLIDQYALTKDESYLKAAFHLLDLNGDGLITLEEWNTVFSSQQADEPEACGQLFRIVDSNGDGFVDEGEFVAMAIMMSSADSQVANVGELTERDLEFDRVKTQYNETKDPTLLEVMFKLIDSDGDGAISKRELQESLLVKGAEDRAMAANMLLHMADKNHDGVLSLEEFVEMINSL